MCSILGMPSGQVRYEISDPWNPLYLESLKDNTCQATWMGEN